MLWYTSGASIPVPAAATSSSLVALAFLGLDMVIPLPGWAQHLGNGICRVTARLPNSAIIRCAIRRLSRVVAPEAWYRSLRPKKERYQVSFYLLLLIIPRNDDQCNDHSDRSAAFLHLQGVRHSADTTDTTGNKKGELMIHCRIASPPIVTDGRIYVSMSIPRP